MLKLFRFLIFFTAIFLISSFAFSFEWPDFLYMFYEKGGVTTAAGAGDVNADGTPDFIVGNVYAFNDSGAVYVYSGADGNLLYALKGPVSGILFGFSVNGVGDVNKDGKADFIVGAPLADPGGSTDQGSAYIYSGNNGSLLYKKDGGLEFEKFAYSVAGMSDINGDSSFDFIVGAPGNASNPQVNGSAYIFSGADGSLIYLKSRGTLDKFGWSVSGAGDVNGDSVPDFIVGAPDASQDGLALVYSGSDGAVIHQRTGNRDGLGWAVTGIGDINSDGKSEFLIGAPFLSSNNQSSLGAAFLYSGANANRLVEHIGQNASNHFGAYVSGTGDISGDNVPDYLIGGDATPSAYAYSGGTLLGEIKVQGGYGYLVSALGDINEDNRAEFLIATNSSAYVFGLVHRSINISSIADIANDQGKNLRIRWTSYPGLTDSLMDGFIVYRRIDSGMVASSHTQLTPDAGVLPPGDWEQVAVLLATGDSTYTTVVPTLADSTSSGKKYSVFFIRGRSINPLLYIDSPLDSGYSVDNLVPSAPSFLAAVGTCQGNRLSYSNPVDPDFQYFQIYRDTLPAFSTATVAGSSIDSFFTDASAPVGKNLYYRVRAVDFSGNEGNPSPQASGLAGLKTDVNADGLLTSSDVVIELNAVFLGTPFPAPFCSADVNCDGNLTSSDVVLELNAVFLGAPITCTP